MNQAARAIVFAGVLLGGLYTELAGAQTTLKAWNIHPEGYPVTEAMRNFASAVSTSTSNRYRIELHNSGELGDQSKAVQMFKSGDIDLAEFNIGPLSDAAPGLKAFNLPFLFTDASHMFRHLDGELGGRLEKTLKDSGFVVLGWYNGGARSFYCADKPIERASDLAGRRIRVMESDVYVEMVKSFGATPMVIPYKELYAAFEQKRVDCAEGNPVSYESTGVYKFAKYVWLDNHMISPEALVITTKIWDKLTPADQAAFTSAGKASALYMRELWEKRVKSARENTTKAGSQFVPVLDAGGLVRRSGPIYKKYMKDPDVMGELLAIIKQ